MLGCREPPPRRKATGILVQDDGERSTGLKSGRCGACTESLMHLLTATLKEADADGLFLHTKPQGVGLTELSEESVLEAGRNV